MSRAEFRSASATRPLVAGLLGGGGDFLHAGPQICSERYPRRGVAGAGERRVPLARSRTDAKAAAPSGSAKDVVALAASAGGLNAISHLLGALPVDFPAAVLIVQHLD